MESVVDKIVWSGLISFGLQFLYIGFRIRFERIYGLFGAAMVLLALSFLAQAGPIPFLALHGRTVAGAYFSLLTTFLFLPVILLFIFEATRIFQLKGLKYFCIADAAFAGFCLWDMSTGNGWILKNSFRPISISPITSLLLLSLWAFMLVLACRSFLPGLQSRSQSDRKPLVWLGLGGAVFAIGTIFELLARSMGLPTHAVALKSAGVFSGVAVYFLMNQFLSLYRANKKTLEQLAAAYATLGESAKMNALGASTATITHEIRNFAATLKGNAVLMGRKLADGEYRQEVDRIRATAERMESIAKDVAVYARAAQPIVSRPVALDKLLRTCVSNWFSESEKKIHLQAYPALPAVMGDSAGLEQVFVNVIRNSLEAGAQSLEFRFRIFGNKLIVVIEDDGQGCQAEELAQIAKPFYSNKSSAGTGLGCSIAETIIKSHGASLRYYSKNALLNVQTGMVVDLVFPIPLDPIPLGRAISKPVVELLVFCSNNPSKSEIVQPMISLGIFPSVLSSEDSYSTELIPENRLPIFLDQAAVIQWKGLGEKSQVIRVLGNRTAAYVGMDGQQKAANFLFTEENLAMLVEGNSQ